MRDGNQEEAADPFKKEKRDRVRQFSCNAAMILIERGDIYA